ncbi:GWxTD domain-containing protein [Cryomorphaceae bacterium 1068]|nr:GWxTD domain-containing protein [Cryomorphaceae bacterium 1068]
MKGVLKLFVIPLIFFSIQAISVPYAVFNHKTFYVPGKGPVVETYFDIYGKSITLLKIEEEEDAFQGEVELTIIFKKDGQIITYDKKNLKTPIMSQGNIVDFIDVQRFAIPSGEYEVEVELKDLNAVEESAVTKASISLDVPMVPVGTFFSDIELVSAYKKTSEPGLLSKSGYDLLPMVSDSILKPEMKEVVVYTELYGTDEEFEKEEMFLLTAYIADADSLKPIESTRKYMRRNSGSVIPILTTLLLENVNQGEYLIILEARTRENELFAKVEHQIKRDKKQAVDVLSLMESEDIDATWVSKFETKASIYDYVHSVRPIATGQEKAMLSNSFREFEKSELKYLRSFMYAFWESRNPGEGETAWLMYKEKVDFVNEEFGTKNKQGFETDRGRVYLQYGPPNDLTDRANEPSSYPYQIWRYYKTGQYNNVRFVFYDPTLMGVDYQLLHAEGIRGEINNPQWRLLLEQRNTPMNNIDDQTGRDHFGGRVDDFFDNPR